MSVWETEKIHGLFWYVKKERGGFILVSVSQNGLGGVYLVKSPKYSNPGDFPEPPPGVMVTITMLPIYDCLVYSYFKQLLGFGNLGDEFNQAIALHASIAARNGTMVYRGESAANGLWDSEPPELLP